MISPERADVVAVDQTPVLQHKRTPAPVEHPVDALAGDVTTAAGRDGGVSICVTLVPSNAPEKRLASTVRASAAPSLGCSSRSSTFELTTSKSATAVVVVSLSVTRPTIRSPPTRVLDISANGARVRRRASPSASRSPPPGEWPPRERTFGRLRLFGRNV